MQVGGNGGPGIGPAPANNEGWNAAIRQARDVAVQALRNNRKKNCAKLFSGHDPIGMLDAMVNSIGAGISGSTVFDNRRINFGLDGAPFAAGLFPPGTAATRAIADRGDVFLNPASFWGTPQQMATTLIHELGHLFEKFYGQNSTKIKPDTSVLGIDRSRQNTEKVRKDCF